MTRGDFGVDEIVRIEISSQNGDTFFVRSDNMERVDTETMGGVLKLKQSWDRRDLAAPRVYGMARKHAPQDADFFIPLYEDRRTIAGFQYYKQKNKE